MKIITPVLKTSHRLLLWNIVRYTFSNQAVHEVLVSVILPGKRRGEGVIYTPGPLFWKSVVTGLKQTYKGMQYTLYTQQNKLFFCGRTTKVGVTPSTLDLSGSFFPLLSGPTTRHLQLFSILYPPYSWLVNFLRPFFILFFLFNSPFLVVRLTFYYFWIHICVDYFFPRPICNNIYMNSQLKSTVIEIICSKNVQWNR